MAKKRDVSEAALDLAQLRKIKRLAKRVVRGIEQMEREILRFRKDRQRKPTEEETAIAVEMYEGDPLLRADFDGGDE